MIRLILASLLFLFSFLVVCKAPMHWLWLTAVAITCYPIFFILLSATSFAAGFWTTKYKLIILLLSAASFIIYLLPIASAWNMNKNVQVALTKNFPVQNPSTNQPFSFLKMFTAQVIEEVQPETMVYKSLPEKELKLDFYSSSTNIVSPTIIVVHGGSWESGDSKQLPELNSYLANKGYNVAAINYRLAPAYQSPAPIEDTKDAVNYLLQHAAQLKVDTNNLILIGRSAGVQVALCAAYCMNNKAIKGVVDFYGPADMVWGAQIKANPLMLDVNKIYREYFGGTYQEVPENFKQASVCEYVNASTPPTLIIHGENDAMVSFIHSQHLEEKLKQNKVPYYFLELPFATHGCDYNLNGPNGQLTTYAVEHFINSVTKHSWKN